MVKLLFWGLLIWLAFKYLPPLLKRFSTHSTPQDAPRDPNAQDMVRCAHCGVFVLRSEALFQGDLAYCGETHRKAGPNP